MTIQKTNKPPKETLKRTPKAVDQWQKISASLKTYKITCILLSAVITVLSLSLWKVSSRGPVVVILDDHNQVYLRGSYQEFKVDQKAVKQFLAEFLKARYEWPELTPETVYRQISPLATKAFRDKVITGVKEIKKKDFKGKKVSQSITNVSIKVDKEKVFASFDKLIKVEGIPLPIPSQAIFQLTTGARTQWNPVGLYVNGIIEHEGK